MRLMITMLEQFLTRKTWAWKQHLCHRAYWVTAEANAPLYRGMGSRDVHLFHVRPLFSIVVTLVLPWSMMNISQSHIHNWFILTEPPKTEAESIRFPLFVVHLVSRTVRACQSSLRGAEVDNDNKRDFLRYQKRLEMCNSYLRLRQKYPIWDVFFQRLKSLSWRLARYVCACIFATSCFASSFGLPFSQLVFDEQIFYWGLCFVAWIRCWRAYPKSRVSVRILVVQKGKEESLASMLQFPGWSIAIVFDSARALKTCESLWKTIQSGNL